MTGPEQPASRLGSARARAEGLQRELALVPIVGMAGATFFGSTGIGALRMAGVDVAPASTAWILAGTCAAMLVCLGVVRRAPRPAAQAAALIELVASFAAMLTEPGIGVPICSAAGLCGVVVGTLSARPGSWRWGPIASVLWVAFILMLPLPPDERAGLVVFPPVLFMATGLLLARVTESLFGSQLEALHSLAELERANVRLAEQRRQVERASQAKSVFFTSMSHELRTPLNAIIGYSELILDDPDGLDPDDVVRIQRSGHHLLSLVNDVLDMSRIEQGEVEIRTGQVDVHGLIDELKDVASGLSKEGGNELVWKVAADVPEVVRADRLRVRQVVLNLMGNALKFTEGGRVQVDVGRTEEHLTFTVEDTGPGIEPELMERLFVPFSQGSHRGLRHGGTGLGLAISQSLARAMGGRITVESELGAGSRFTLELPLRRRRDSLPPPPDAAAA